MKKPKILKETANMKKPKILTEAEFKAELLRLYPQVKLVVVDGVECYQGIGLKAPRP